jgi:RNA polymerase sigma factor for flagellar operon FliA
MQTAKSQISALWDRYLCERRVEDRNALVEHYTPLVHAQAARLSRRLPMRIRYEEICSAGYDGLIEAVESFDPERKAKFETFCQRRIGGAVMDWLRSLDSQSRTIRTFEKQRNATQEELEVQLHRRPSQAEVARGMGISTERYEELARVSQRGREVHFSVIDSRAGESSTSLSDRPWDVCDQKQDDPSARVARHMLCEYITRGLSRDERLVLILYYYEELTMAEIGAVLEISESRVSQVHKDVIRRLQARYTQKAGREQLVA